MSIQRVVCGPETITPVYTRLEGTGVDFLTHFTRTLRVHVVSETTDTEGCDTLVFDMLGVDAPLANALRRVLLTETPSVAFDAVFFMKNTSIIQDEVLAHRIGMIPLRIDPRQLDYVQASDGETNDMNTAVFRFHAMGGHVRREDAPGYVASSLPEVAGDDDVEARYTKVYARDLEWVPHGTQPDRFPVPAAPVNPDILLAKLAPGQEIQFEAHAVKGIGKDHAKFSPVATAAYRLLPDIRIKEDFFDEQADALVRTCPMNVFDIEDIADRSERGPQRRAVVKRPRDCTVCRECIRDPEWNKRISIERVMDHFIYSVESTGALPSSELVLQALGVLREKCATLLSALDDLRHSETRHVLGPADAARATVAVMRTEPDDLTS